MGRTLESFLGLARDGEEVRTLLGPDLLDRVAERAAVEAEGRRVEVVVEHPDDAPAIRGDPAVLEHALTNLARNAIGATPEGDRVTLRWERAEDGGARITVRDHGPGFPAEGREALLRLGGTTRPGGHGLGLPLAQRFARAHGGRLALLDAPGGGGLVEVRLPAADPEGEAKRG
jgi:signal transduction histidine kinase